MSKFILFMSAYILLLTIFQNEAVFAFGPPSTESNNDGLKHYKSEEYPEAFSRFADALARDPFNSKYHLNLGDAFYKGGDLPKALAEYESAAQNPKADTDTRFKSFFNAGNAAIEGKDIPKALEYYQKALELKPDSIETKTNIELAIKEDQKKKDNKGDDKKDDKEGNGDKNQKDKKDDKDKKNDKDKKDEQPQKPKDKSPQPTPKPTPHGFKSQDLNESDVQRILEELKRQEQEIRARQYKDNKNVPDSQIEKDW
jgi:Ca-activated chloride channel family protein